MLSLDIDKPWQGEHLIAQTQARVNPATILTGDFHTAHSYLYLKENEHTQLSLSLTDPLRIVLDDTLHTKQHRKKATSGYTVCHLDHILTEPSESEVARAGTPSLVEKKDNEVRR